MAAGFTCKVASIVEQGTIEKAGAMVDWKIRRLVGVVYLEKERRWWDVDHG